jgi:hypothetical protein
LWSSRTKTKRLAKRLLKRSYAKPFKALVRRGTGGLVRPLPEYLWFKRFRTPHNTDERALLVDSAAPTQQQFPSRLLFSPGYQVTRMG